MATTQNSTFEAVYNVIAKADFTGLVKGSESLKTFARDTTASTKTVQDLTNVVGHSVEGAKAYLGAWDQGFKQVATRFEELGKTGATVGGVIKLVGGTLKDVVETQLIQAEIGFKTLGNLLGVDLVKGALAFAGATVVIAGGIALIGKAFSSAITEGVVYARNLETTRIMMSGMKGDAVSLATSLVDSANRASWDRVGKAYSGYIKFFDGLGRAYTAAKGGLSNWSAGLMESTAIGSAAFKDMGEWLDKASQGWAGAAGSLDRLKLGISDLGRNTTSITQLNEQFGKIGASMGVGVEVVQKYFDTLKTQSRDADASLKILQLTAAATLKNEFFKQNANDIITVLSTLKAGATAPIALLDKLGVSAQNSAGHLASNAVILGRIIDLLVKQGAITKDVGTVWLGGMTGGKVETQRLEQEFETRKKFHSATLAEEIVYRKELYEKALSGKIETPEKVQNLQAAWLDAIRQKFAQNAEFLRFEANNVDRLRDIDGDRIRDVKQNAAIEYAINEEFKKQFTGMPDALKQNAARYLSVQYGMYKDLRAAAMDYFDSQASLVKSSIEATKSTGGMLGGKDAAEAQIALLEQMKVKTQELYAAIKPDTAKGREGQEKQLQFVNEQYSVAKKHRSEVIAQTEMSMQMLNQLAIQAGSSAQESIARAREISKNRIDAINFEYRTTTDVVNKNSLLLEMVKTSRDLRAEELRIQREAASVASNSNKESIDSLREQGVHRERLRAAMIRGEDPLKPSEPTRDASNKLDPNDPIMGIRNAETVRATNELANKLEPLFARAIKDTQANPARAAQIEKNFEAAMEKQTTTLEQRNAMLKVYNARMLENPATALAMNTGKAQTAGVNEYTTAIDKSMAALQKDRVGADSATLKYLNELRARTEQAKEDNKDPVSRLLTAIGNVTDAVKASKTSDVINPVVVETAKATKATETLTTAVVETTKQAQARVEAEAVAKQEMEAQQSQARREYADILKTFTTKPGEKIGIVPPSRYAFNSEAGIAEEQKRKREDKEYAAFLKANPGYVGFSEVTHTEAPPTKLGDAHKANIAKLRAEEAAAKAKVEEGAVDEGVAAIRATNAANAARAAADAEVKANTDAEALRLNKENKRVENAARVEEQKLANAKKIRAELAVKADDRQEVQNNANTLPSSPEAAAAEIAAQRKRDIEAAKDAETLRQLDAAEAATNARRQPVDPTALALQAMEDANAAYDGRPSIPLKSTNSIPKELPLKDFDLIKSLNALNAAIKAASSVDISGQSATLVRILANYP